MTSYVAFLRGVMPTNLKMADLKAAYEDAGFENVRTLLSSGNVVFTYSKGSRQALEEIATSSLEARVGRSFQTSIFETEQIATLIASDPYASFTLPVNCKKVMTFLKNSPQSLNLPVTDRGATIYALKGVVAFSAYTPHPDGPVFMSLLEKTFGKEVTTRTLATVQKCLAAAAT